jgi:hypothetical protein
MPDRADEFRNAASDCLYLARTTSDENTRAALVTMAQKWLELANGPTGQVGFEAAIQEFNMRQMEPTSLMQQQQQVQPRDDDKKD